MAAAPAVRTQPGGSRRQAMRCGAARQLVCAGVLQHLQRYTRGTRPRLSSRCLGYVGEGTRPAGEYHCRDFEWHEQVGAGQAAVQRQQLELQLQQQQRAAAGLEAAGTGERGGELAAMHSASAEQGPRGATASESGSGCSDDSWERFHAQHSQARFFKEKRYLMLEFPALAVAHPPQHIAEIGCGCGSALLPVLKANPSCRVTGCDISATALRLFHLAAQQAGVQPHRIRTFTLDAASSTADSSGKVTADSSADSSCDSTASIAGGTSGSVTSSAEPAVPDSAGGCSPLAGLGADSLLLVFTLSALPPAAHAAALTHAYAALRPGGLLLFRDYGLYDGAQLRFPGAQMLGPNLYRRSEGTLAYFFSTEALRAAATAVGFQEVECEYARVEMRNRKSGAAMRRVFVHGVFCKPL